MSIFRPLFLVFGVILPVSILAKGADPAFQALWVDAWHPGFQSASQVTKLMDDARKANCNTLFVEVRKRADAYYKGSGLEPAASCVSGDFDPLADIIKKAHDTNLGPRIQIHAWFVAYPVVTITKRGDNSPVVAALSNPKHPFSKHQDWLTESETGAKFDGNHYSFDPGVPAVQDHLFQVAMDIVSRYDIDGFHFDHIRYPAHNWGYNSNAVERFDRIFGRSGKPAVDDPLWNQFRRDQVTALVRKLYLSIIAVKPNITISASTVTWAPAASSDAGWATSAPFRDAFQDWRGWMEEGILDVNVPMVFFRDSSRLGNRSYRDWCSFAEDHKYSRLMVIGQASYLNSFSGTLAQLEAAKSVSLLGNRSDGVALYSYATPTRSAGLVGGKRLTNDVARANQTIGLFGKKAVVPQLSRKKDPVTGGVKGIATDESTSKPLDGADVSFQGTTNIVTRTDGTGFFGAVGLLAGSYNVTCSYPGYKVAIKTITISKGKISDLIVPLKKNTAQ